MSKRHRHSWPSDAVLGIAGVVILLFLLLPVFIVIPMSFSSARFLSFPPPSFSLRWYQEYFHSTEWLLATQVSLQTALATCVFATPIGVAAAYGVQARPGPVSRLIYTLLVMPLMVPHIIIAVGIFFIYARMSAN